MVIIHKDILKHKTETFINENNIILLHKDQLCHKQIQQTLQKCNDIIDKTQHKYILQIQPTDPTLNTLIKIHKDNPIRPVINNIKAHHINLPKASTKNSTR